MNKLLNILIPLIDHIYIFQLLEYQAVDFFRWFLKHPLKRNLQRKQKVVWTLKARILLIISFILVVIAALLISVKPVIFFATSIILMQFSPVFILLANLLFKPLEAYQKRKIVSAAITKRKRLQDLKVIAIVGSYAKTSTKNILYTLLWKDFRVVKTPKSYNTELSIARSIISDLKSNTEVYICEMDAYHPGEIKRLCEIAQPNLGIITAIGPQHLERFGSMDALAKTQFELKDSLPLGGGLGRGALFLNHNDEWSEKMGKNLNQNIIHFNNSTNYISNRKEYEDYQTFTLHLTSINPPLSNSLLKGERAKQSEEQIIISLPLKGEHNAINFLAAAVIAHALGVSVKTIKERAKLILPTDHRLEIRTQGNITILDNTYNANPKAALASLELLDSFKDSKKIIITPGFVELGKDHEKAHEGFSKSAANVVDDFIIVGENAKKPLLNGLKLSNFPQEHIHAVDTTQKALAHLSSLTFGKTVVLLENDLPDQYF